MTRKAQVATEDTALSDGENSLGRDSLVSFEEAVNILGTSKPTLYRLLKQKDIQGLKVGNRWRFRTADLVAYMERKPSSIAQAPMRELEAALAAAEEELQRLGLELPPKVGFKSPDSDLAPADQQKVIHLLNTILKLALHAGASDIHFLPQSDSVQVRLRVDGVLHEVRRLPSSLLQPIVDRVKVMAEMNIEERRVPQDGRIHIYYSPNDKEFDILAATCPSAYGESVVMRILDKVNMLVTLDQLDMEPDDQAQLRRWLNVPYGITLVTGPSGSGKTTTIYSCLNEINKPDRKVVTIEDPVEHQLPGVMHVHVNRKSGLTVPVALRAFLRQDPDVVMVTEISDLETAQMVTQIVLSGRLLITTLPVSSAIEAVMHLRDIGLEPFLICSSLTGISAQRLARRICENCKEVHMGAEVPATLRKLARDGGYTIPENAKFYRGKGCPSCRETGYEGRIMIYELIEWSAALSEAFLRGVSRDELAYLAVEGGAKTLLANGILKATQGQTTLDEVQRVLGITS